MRLLDFKWLSRHGLIPLFSQLVSIHFAPVGATSALVPCLVNESGARDHALVANNDICRLLLRQAPELRLVDTHVAAIRVFDLQLALVTLTQED